MGIRFQVPAHAEEAIIRANEERTRHERFLRSWATDDRAISISIRGEMVKGERPGDAPAVLALEEANVALDDVFTHQQTAEDLSLAREDTGATWDEDSMNDDVFDWSMSTDIIGEAMGWWQRSPGDFLATNAVSGSAPVRGTSRWFMLAADASVDAVTDRLYRSMAEGLMESEGEIDYGSKANAFVEEFIHEYMTGEDIGNKPFYGAISELAQGNRVNLSTGYLPGTEMAPELEAEMAAFDQAMAQQSDQWYSAYENRETDPDQHWNKYAQFATPYSQVSATQDKARSRQFDQAAGLAEGQAELGRPLVMGSELKQEAFGMALGDASWFGIDGKKMTDSQGRPQYSKVSGGRAIANVFTEPGTAANHWLSGTADFGKQIFLDPLDVVGVGAVGKVGDAARVVGVTETGARRAADLSDLEKAAVALRNAPGIGGVDAVIDLKAAGVNMDNALTAAIREAPTDLEGITLASRARKTVDYEGANRYLTGPQAQPMVTALTEAKTMRQVDAILSSVKGRVPARLRGQLRNAETEMEVVDALLPNIKGMDLAGSMKRSTEISSYGGFTDMLRQKPIRAINDMGFVVVDQMTTAALDRMYQVQQRGVGALVGAGGEHLDMPMAALNNRAQMRTMVGSTWGGRMVNNQSNKAVRVDDIDTGYKQVERLVRNYGMEADSKFSRTDKGRIVMSDTVDGLKSELDEGEKLVGKIEDVDAAMFRFSQLGNGNGSGGFDAMRQIYDAAALKMEMDGIDPLFIRAVTSMLEDQGLNSKFFTDAVGEVGKYPGTSFMGLMDGKVGIQPGPQLVNEMYSGAINVPDPRMLRRTLAEQNRITRIVNSFTTQKVSLHMDPDASGISKMIPDWQPRVGLEDRAALRMSRTFLSNVWKPMKLLRFGYIPKVVLGDEQGRMTAAGLATMWAPGRVGKGDSLLAYFAYLMADPKFLADPKNIFTKTAKTVTNRLGKAAEDVTGVPMRAARQYQDTVSLKGNVYGEVGAMRSENWIKVGIDDTEKYSDGLATEIDQLANDPVVQILFTPADETLGGLDEVAAQVDEVVPPAAVEPFVPGEYVADENLLSKADSNIDMDVASASLNRAEGYLSDANEFSKANNLKITELPRRKKGDLSAYEIDSAGGKFFIDKENGKWVLSAEDDEAITLLTRLERHVGEDAMQFKTLREADEFIRKAYADNIDQARTALPSRRMDVEAARKSGLKDTDAVAKHRADFDAAEAQRKAEWEEASATPSVKADRELRDAEATRNLADEWYADHNLEPGTIGPRKRVGSGGEYNYQTPWGQHTIINETGFEWRLNLSPELKKLLDAEDTTQKFGTLKEADDFLRNAISEATVNAQRNVVGAHDLVEEAGRAGRQANLKSQLQAKRGIAETGPPIPASVDKVEMKPGSVTPFEVEGYVFHGGPRRTGDMEFGGLTNDPVRAQKFADVANQRNPGSGVVYAIRKEDLPEGVQEVLRKGDLEQYVTGKEEILSPEEVQPYLDKLQEAIDSGDINAEMTARGDILDNPQVERSIHEHQYGPSEQDTGFYRGDEGASLPEGELFELDRFREMIEAESFEFAGKVAARTGDPVADAKAFLMDTPEGQRVMNVITTKIAEQDPYTAKKFAEGGEYLENYLQWVNARAHLKAGGDYVFKDPDTGGIVDSANRLVDPEQYKDLGDGITIIREGDAELLKAYGTGMLGGDELGEGALNIRNMGSADYKKLRADLLRRVKESTDDMGESPFPSAVKYEKSGFAGYDEKKMTARIVDFFMDMTVSMPAETLNRAPAFRQFYWQALGSRIPAMTDEVAAVAIQKAKDQGVWGRVKKVMAEVGEQPKVIDNLDDADLYAKSWAATATQDLLFDFAERKNFFDAISLISPFADAWLELFTSWGRIFAANPTLARRPLKALDELRGDDPMEWGEDEFDAKDGGFFYMNSYGEEVFAIPFASGFVSALSGKLGTDENLPDMKFEVGLEGLNMIAGQFYPGVGPVVTVPAAGIIPNTPEWQGLRDALAPFGMEDTMGEELVSETLGASPTLTRFLNAVTEGKFMGGEDERIYNNTVGYMLKDMITSGEVTAEDLADPDKNSAAMTTAQDRAQQVYFIRSLMQFVSPAAPGGPRFVFDQKDIEGIEDDDSRYTLIALQDSAMAYYDIRNDEASGDDSLAMDLFVQRYGFDPTATLVSSSKAEGKSGVTETSASFEVEHPKAFDQYGLTAYYLQPDSPDDPFYYQAWEGQFKNGERVAKPLDEQSAEYQSRMAASEYRNARTQLREGVDDGTIPVPEGMTTKKFEAFVLDKVKADIISRIPDYEATVDTFNDAKRQEQIAELRDWQNYSPFDNDPTQKAVTEFFNKSWDPALKLQLDSGSGTSTANVLPFGDSGAKMGGESWITRITVNTALLDEGDEMAEESGNGYFKEVWEEIIRPSIHDYRLDEARPNMEVDMGDPLKETRVKSDPIEVWG